MKDKHRYLGICISEFYKQTSSPKHWRPDEHGQNPSHKETEKIPEIGSKVTSTERKKV